MSGDDPHPASKWLLRLRRFRCRSYSGVVFRLVDMLANERDHVCGTIDTCKSRIEDQLGHACCGLNLDIKNVRLQRVEEALVQQLGWHLIRYRLAGLDEHLVCDTLRLQTCSAR